MQILLLIILILYPCIQLWQLVVLYLYKDKPAPEPAVWPQISILVAARNEENNIAACLESLINQDYPRDCITIYIGDDQSTDNTFAIASKYSEDHSHVKVISIVDDDSGLRAKARVMAQLDQHAQGSCILVTDADVQVKPQWAKYMVRHLNESTGVASGTTMVKGESTIHTLEGMDWAYFMGLLNVISYSGVPATAVGNNMIIRQDAYWQTGGYSKIHFSITEDYKLYSEVCKLGWKWDNVMAPEVLAFSNPTSGFKTLLHQRKRWLSGGKELPFYWWLLFGVFGLFYFLLPILLITAPITGIGIWVIKWIMQCLQVRKIYTLVGEKPPSAGLLLLYELYLITVTVSTALFFIWPGKTIWKNRKY